MAREITHPATGATANQVKELMATFDQGELVALGLVEGHVGLRRFGLQNTIGAAADSVIGDIVDQLEPWMPLISQEVEVVSDDAQDDATGVGARSITITGLDADWMEQTAVVVLDGLTPVVTTGLFWMRVHSAVVTTTAQYRGTSSGNITVQETESPAEPIVMIRAGHGGNLTTHYTVPANKKFLVRNWQLQIESGKTMEVHFWFAPNGNDIVAPYSPKITLLETETVVGTLNGTFDPPSILPPYSDVWATGLVSAQTGQIFFGYSGVLITP